MLRTLLKKQFMSLLGSLGGGKKGGAKSIRFYLAAVLGITALFAVMIYLLFDQLCAPLCLLGLDWLYFVYAALFAIALSVVGGIFMAQTQLYEAKDNDLLLSLPVPSHYILLVRMVSLYVQHLLLCAAVFVPAFVAYAMVASVTAGQVFIWIAMLALMPLFALFVTCLLGFLLALATSRLRDKTLVTVILSMAFLVAYFVVYSELTAYINALIANGAAIGGGIKSYFYPLYKLGTACTGDGMGLLLTAGIILSLFAALYVALSKTYIALVTGKRSSSRHKYSGKPYDKCSPGRALFKKEAQRFFGTGIYFLNCGLGVVLMVLMTVFFMAKRADVLALLALSPSLRSVAPLVVCVLVSFIAAMDAVTAPSVSLEGRALWILQSSPVGMWQALKAKLALHYVVSAPAATVCMIPFIAILKPHWTMAILMLVVPSVVVLMIGELGLVYNLKKPNLDWDNETFVIKQSMSVLLTLLTGWAIFTAFIGLYLAAGKYMPDPLYLLLCLLAMSALCIFLRSRLKRRGAAIMQYL